MIRKIQYITFCLSAIVGVAQTSSLKFDFHTGEFSQTLLSEDIDSITFSHGGKSNVTGFDVVESVWNYSETSEDTISWMTTGSQVVNDMTLKDGKLYVVRRNGSNNDNTIEIVDAYKGTKIGSLNTSLCTIGAHYISAIETLGNSIIACNLTEEGNFIIYKWDDDTSEPEMMLNVPAPCGRIGDAMSVSGDMENGRIWFVSGHDVYYYTVSKGKITSTTTPTIINVDLNVVTHESNNVTVEADGSFWVSPKDGVPTHFTANDGVFIEELPNVFPYNQRSADMKIFTYNGRKYAVASTYLNRNNETLADGAVLIIDLTTGSLICTLPPLGLGSTRNTSFRSSICAEVNGDGYLYVWLNVPFQGAACYRLGNNCVIGDETLCENVWTKYGVFSNKIDVDDYILFSPKLTNEYGITLGSEVDLGLSVNWSGWDLGATSAMEYGAHFAWGELIPRNSGFNKEGYYYYAGTSEYRFIGEEISGTDYDAARYHLGEGWRMPTKAEADELLQKCKWVYTVANNIPGYKVIGPNGNSIFLPLNGHIVGDELIDDGVHCCYWTGSLVINSDGSHSNTKANVLLCGPGKPTETVIDDRRWGHCIRPVKSKK